MTNQDNRALDVYLTTNKNFKLVMVLPPGAAFNPTLYRTNADTKACTNSKGGFKILYNFDNNILKEEVCVISQSSA